jgi:hypothetical protein
MWRDSGQVYLGVAREFFRIVRDKQATLEDFKSHRALGKRPPANPAYQREWSEGISVYSSLDRACQVSKAFHFRLGSYVATIRVPEDGTVDFRQTTADNQHFTIYAEPDVIFSFVEGEPTLIPDAPGD